MSLINYLNMGYKFNTGYLKMTTINRHVIMAVRFLPLEFNQGNLDPIS